MSGDCDIYEVLRKYWGYDAFRECQEDIILSVLKDKDTLGLLPTGGGKSLTFQIPGLILDGLTIVVTPLIALMKDQVDNLRERRIKASHIHSGMRSGEIRQTLDKCIYGKTKFLYISPERLSSNTFINALRHIPVSLIVVDEAHCISQWGYDFRPSYLKIAGIRDFFPEAPVLALTASATPEVVNDIQDKLHFRNNSIVVRKSFCRDNLSYIVRTQENKPQKLLASLSSIYGSAIIYVRSRAKTKLFAELLQKEGFSADYYHAGLSSEEKRDKQDRWKTGEIRIIVATNAFGMGIDKPDVRLVAHLDVPNSLEEYYQEAGRGGRDGKKAYALLLVSSKDKGVLRRRISEAFPDKEFIREVYARMCDFLNIPLGGGFDKLYDLNFSLFCSTFHLPAVSTLSALKILMASGYIEYIDEVETQSRMMILVDKQSLYNIEGMTAKMDNILEIILRSYSGFFADYVFIDEGSISWKYRIPSEDIYETLLFLNRKHIIHYIPRKRTPYVYFTSSRVEQRHIEITRTAYEEGKLRLEHRINSMIKYAYNQESCREQLLLNYFGEKSTTVCNHCDICIEKKTESSSEKELSDSIFYVLSNQSRTTAEIINILSYPRQDIINMLRTLTDEGKIIYSNGVFSLK